MATVPAKATGGAFSHEDANQPFWVSSVTYDSTNDRMVITVGPGRIDWNNGTVLEYTANQTIYHNAPAVSTTYHVHLRTSGVVVTTSALDTSGGVRLAQYVVGATKPEITLTDKRGLLPNTTGTLKTTGGTMTGDLYMGNNYLRQVEFYEYREHYVSQAPAAATTATLDVRTPVHFVSPAGAVTIAFSNWPASGNGGSVTLIMNNGGTARATTWPAAVDWPDGKVPTATTGVDIYTFISVNGGATIYGFQAGKAMA